MKIRPKKSTVRNLKIFGCGIFAGMIILVTANHHIGHIINRRSEALKKQFPTPKFESSFSGTREVESYSFDYYGNKIAIQDDSVKIYTFDENGNMTVKEGEKSEVPVEDNSYLLDEYVTDTEANVYKVLKNKDNIKDQYNIYVLFTWMEDLYQEYLNRKPFNTLGERKEAIYNVGYKYILSNEGYTMGGYKYSDLSKTIQGDILDIFKKINYMRENGTVKEESKFDAFLDDTGKVIKYGVFKIGRK